MIIIDAISSPGVRYDAVAATLNRYRKYSIERGRDGYTDGITELIASFDEVGGTDGWASTIGSHRRKTTGDNDYLVADLILAAARRLDASGIRRVDDLRTAVAGGVLSDVEKAWRSIPCQGPGVSWDYALLLAGRE